MQKNYTIPLSPRFETDRNTITIENKEQISKGILITYLEVLVKLLPNDENIRNGLIDIVVGYFKGLHIIE